MGSVSFSRLSSDDVHILTTSGTASWRAPKDGSITQVQQITLVNDSGATIRFRLDATAAGSSDRKLLNNERLVLDRNAQDVSVTGACEVTFSA